MRVFAILIVLVLTFPLLADFPGFDLYATYLDTIPEGPMNGSSIGENVAILGDINGDGFDDFAVSAMMGADTATGAVTGKVYIWFGQQGAPLSLPPVPDIILTGENNADWFGFDISGGDFNGDGFSDIAILAQGFWPYSKGKCYVYLGSETPDSTPDFTYTPEYGLHFRYYMPFVGDVNGDGYEDIALSVNNGGGNQIYLFYGDSIPDLVVDDTLISDLGYLPNIGYGGDINDDGYDDLLIGDFHARDDSGNVHVFLGGDPFPDSASVIIHEPTAGKHFGWEVGILGDLNKDRFDEIGVLTTSPHQCWVYWGSDDSTYECAGHIDDPLPANGYAQVILGAGDTDFDSHDDFIIGAPRTGANPGMVLVFYGASELPDSADRVLTGEEAYDQYGFSVAVGGDINGDGYNDVAIGAFKSHIPGYYGGKAYLHSGKMIRMNNFDPQVEIEGQPARGWAGYVVASGDINGDGFNDVAFLHELRNKSRVYLCLGDPSGMDLEPDYILSDGRDTTRFGASIAFGDLDGDGIDDMAVGAPFWKDYSSGRFIGEVSIYLGRSSFYDVPDYVFHCPEGSRRLFGNSVDFIGDLNGDGGEELLVGAPENLNTAYMESLGCAYLFFGGSLWDTLPDKQYYGEYVKTGFGFTVIGPGDMTGDGIPDYAISAHRRNHADPGFGRVYLYEGNATPTDTPIVIYDDTVYQWLGKSMAAPGDLNGDGYNDLIINCRSEVWGHFGDYGNGAVRVYLGGDPPSEIPYWEITAPEESLGFGIGIGELGDINLDGYPDFAIGAPKGIPDEWRTFFDLFAVVGHSSGERVFVYYGGQFLDCDPDLILTPPKGHENFGFDICAAGMTSWDGSNDIVIGAPGNSMAGYEMGKVYLLSSIFSPVAEGNSKPEEIALHIYPNPFNSSVRISFWYGSESAKPLSASPPGACRVEIFDINGRCVYAPSPSVPLPAGEGGNSFSPWEKVAEGRMRALVWQPEESLPSGVYLIRAKIGDKEIMKKTVYLK